MSRLARLFPLRRIVALLLLTSAALGTVAPAAAQAWPSRPLTMVVP